MNGTPHHTVFARRRDSESAPKIRNAKSLQRKTQCLKGEIYGRVARWEHQRLSNRPIFNIAFYLPQPLLLAYNLSHNLTCSCTGGTSKARSTMSQPTGPSPAFQKEKTFSSYNEAQGKHYAQVRRNYSPAVYEIILEQHKSGGGRFDTLLDVGCGPGLATFSLAPFFEQTIGLDPSEGMLSTARSMVSSNDDETTARQVRFEVSTAGRAGQQSQPSSSRWQC